LKTEFDQELDLVTAPVGLHSTPIVAKNVVIIGAAFETGANPKSRANVKGAVRGYDARTGKRLWLFRTIPQLGEFGNDTWEKDSWRYTGNTGAWAQISVDEGLGMAYLPVELPTHDYYGGERPGKTRSSARAWWRWTSRRPGNGISSWCITAYGHGIRARRFSPTSPSTAGWSRRSRSRPSRGSSMCSIA
jgi:hypothetical protein